MRVVSLLASGTEFVCALGAGAELVGRSHECDSPPWVRDLPACTRPAFDVNAPSGVIDAEVRRRLKSGEPLYHVDSRLIHHLRPDLLITQAHCQVCAVTPGDVETAGCAVAAQVLALQAGTVAGIYAGAREIGKALGRAQEAERLVADLRRRIDSVRRDVRSRRPPTVVVLEWTDPPFAMGNWGPELVESANGLPALAEPGRHSRAIDWRQVREANPEYLVIAPCGFDLPRASREIPFLEGLPGWFELGCVRAGKVALADGNRYFNRSGPTIVQTAEILAEILHDRPAGHRGRAWKWYRPAPRGEVAAAVAERHAAACAAGRPTYADPATGYAVFTADFLKARGACCGSGCRHCPY